MTRREVSPLVATLILMAVVVVIAVAVAYWIQGIMGAIE